MKKIKKPDEKDDKIKKGNISSDINYPIFCFKHLNLNVSIKGCDNDLYRQFFERIQKLSTLDWNAIAASHRHSFGWEQLPVDKIKPQLPGFVTPDVEKLYVFRYTGDNRPFIALRRGSVIHILFIEANFGDVYNH